MAPRYALSRKRATQLLRRARIRKPPVPIEKLAILLKAEIRHQPFSGELYGMVYRNSDGTAVIGVNPTDSPNRQRFTIGLRSGISAMAVDDKELVANQFAAELLMPAEMITRDVELLVRLDVDK